MSFASNRSPGRHSHDSPRSFGSMICWASETAPSTSYGPFSVTRIRATPSVTLVGVGILVVRGAGCAVPHGDRRLLRRGELVALDHRVPDELVLVVGQALVDHREGGVDGRPVRALLREV